MNVNEDIALSTVIVRSKTKATADKVKLILLQISHEIECAGVYPYNGGELSKNEVCRRAGIGKTTIFSPKQSEVNKMVDAFLESFQLKSNKASGRRTYQELSAAWKQKYIDLSASHHKTELDFQALRNDYERLLRNNNVLHEEVAYLREILNKMKIKIVVPIK
ncbi:hypothetical protein FBY04_12289 [Pseudomonas sp. SJZ080]|nr:hypothetical protein FBY04_12289 [Pseudomonas sp. SJZ080]